MNKNKVDIIFVVLHYNVINETNNCVESIKKNIDRSSFHIVIVDNASPNGSGKLLEEKYKNDRFVSVIIGKKNLGFAKGNNIGIQYAYENFDMSFLCCLNNDTLLEERRLIEKLEDEYNKSNAYVIGPKIFLKQNKIQPVQKELRDIQHYRKSLKKLKKRRFCFSLRYYYKIVVKFLGRNDKQELAEKQQKTVPNVDNYYTNIILHGCCLFFTPLAIEDRFLFNSRTFMFYEEQLLRLYLKNNNFISVYQPKIVIKHMEDVATDSVLKSSRSKQLFLIKNYIKSLKILIDEMEKIDS